MARRRKLNRPTPTLEKMAPASAPSAKSELALPILFGLLTFWILVPYPIFTDYMRWVGVAAVVALALLDWLRRLLRGEELSFDVADLVLLGLIVYGALSLLWTANLLGGIQTVIIATAGLALSAYLKRFATPATMTAIIIAIGLGVPGALAQQFLLPPGNWWGYGNRGYLAEGLTLSAIFMWPLWCRKTLASRAFAALTAAIAIGYLVALSRSMIEAFVFATFAAIASIALSFRKSARLGWACVAAWLVLPLIAAWVGWDALQLTERLLLRVELWVNCELMIAQRPIFGHGLGSFIEIYPLFKEAHGDLIPFVEPSFQSYVTELEAAHNEPLQLLAELGVVGLLPFLAYVGIVLRAAARRMADDPFAAAGGAALVAVLCESLIEYPFQRCATMFLAVLAVSFAGHGNPWGLRRWRLTLPVPVRYAAAPVGAIAAILLTFASYRQFEAEARLDAAHQPGVDPIAQFNMVYVAHTLDPLDRRILTALPVLLDGVLHLRSVAMVGQSLIDQVYRDVDRGGRNNTAALVAHAQYLLIAGGNNAEFQKVLADLKRGSARVAAAWAIEARYQFLQGQFAAALASATEGLKFADVRGQVPSADAAMQQNLQDVQQAALTQLRLQALRQQQLQQQPKELVPSSR